MSALPHVLHEDLPPAPYDESGILELSPSEAQALAASLPYSVRFSLRDRITPLQQAYLDIHGFVVFDRVASVDEVERIKLEAQRVQEQLLSEGRRSVFGVPVWIGRGPEGEPFLQRLAFTSVFSDFIHDFVRDARFEPVRTLIGEDARIGDREKDGVVLNRYVRTPGSLRPGLGWHTDALRDLFYNWKVPGPMLNVGLHMDRIRPEDGGLRILPGTHRDGFAKMAFRKPYFVWHRPDAREVAVETWPGDLTVHDGRTWHRVQASPHTGARSMRTSMYVPYVCDAYQPKDEHSKPMLYMRLFDAAMRAKGLAFRVRNR